MNVVAAHTRFSSITGQIKAAGKHAENPRLHRNKRAFALATLLEVIIALEADAWVGTRRSNLSRLIDELRCTRVAKCGGPFVEVGRHTLQW